jgi:metal-sulfur cluster biosynthetic enzyme
LEVANMQETSRIEADAPEADGPQTVSATEVTAADRAEREEARATGPVSKDAVLEALKEVIDPELGINIVDLGLVYDVTIDADTVHITYTLTTMGCPIGPLIEAQMKQLLDPIEGIDHVDAEMVLRPAWTPEMMSEEAKEALGYL